MTDRVAERVYVLRLRGNRYYVGSTLRCVKARWSEHCTGAGSRWTKRYAPEQLFAGWKSQTATVTRWKTK